MAAFNKLTASELSALAARFAKPQSASAPQTVADSAAPIVQRTQPRAELTSFAQLPAYKQLQVQLKVAATTGIAVPYFMLHQGLAKEYTEVAGRRLLNFSTYDYLGLNGDERLNAAAAAAAQRYGTSASASRLVAGERPIHRELEAALAAHYGAEDCVVMVSGFACNVTTIASLFGSGDVIYTDKLCHNSIMTGAQDSRAVRVIYPHNDMAALRELLVKTRALHQRALIVTEGVFSMDGNIAKLKELVALKREFNCFLMVDEAHALGCIGASGKGSFEQAGIDPSAVDIWMGTLSKTLCTCGGYIAGCRALIELLKYKASGFVYSVGISPVLAAVALEALTLSRQELWRTQKLQENGAFALRRARELGLNTGLAEGTAILPIIVGSSMKAAFLANLLLDHGICALPIIYPVVAENAARLRLFLSASHHQASIETALQSICNLLPEATAREAQFVHKVRGTYADESADLAVSMDAAAVQAQPAAQLKEDA